MSPLPARILLLALALAVSGKAAAQSSAGPTLDPTRLLRDLEAEQRQQQRREDSNLRLPAPAEAAPPPVSRPVSKPLFRLKSVTIVGAHAIPGDRIAELYAPFIGKSVSSTDLEEIARLISELYRAEGYHLSRAIVPPQDIQNGALRVRVIEGRIVEIAVKSGRGSRAERILEAVRYEEPARLATLERYLLLVNDTPGHKVSETQIEEIGVASGNFRLMVKLETWRGYTYAGVDNFGVPAVGQLLAQYSTALNSVFSSGDAIGFNASVVPDSPRELAFGQLWYDMPIGVEGARFGLSAGYGAIHPGDERRLVGRKTISEAVEARLSTAPLRTRKSSLWFTAHATLQNIVETETSGTVYEDRLRTVGIKADYQVQDSLGGWNYLALGIRQGLDVFNASPEGGAPLSRADGSASFTKAEFSFTRIQKLNEIWSVRFAAAGQWASRPLLGSQEFNLGGRNFGYGYDTGLIGGDHGIGALLELRYDQKVVARYLRGYQLFSFVDAGTVRNILPGDDWVASLVSVGLGARFFFPDDLLTEIGVAFPLSHPSSIDVDRSPRVFFLVSKTFKTCPDRPYWQCD